MATLAATSLTGSGSRAVTILTLVASDTFVYDAAKNPVLVINNVTGGALTPNLLGDAVANLPIVGGGETGLDTSGGYEFASIGAGDTVAIPLNTIAGFLTGVIDLTGADACEAQLLES